VAIVAFAGSTLLQKNGGLLEILGLALLIAGSSFLVGAVFGLIFGIPKTLQQNTAAPPPEEPAESRDVEGSKAGQQRQRIEYRGNTSLEQISDWLTKILIGISLTQWNDLRDEFQKMVIYAAEGFGDTPSYEVFTGGIILLSALCGFFSSYLLTRLFLPLALTKTDIENSRMFDELRQDADRQVETLRKLSPLTTAETTAAVPSAARQQILDQLAALARDYENLRSTLRSGPERTRKMETVTSQMRTLAPMVDTLLREQLQNSASPGQRLAAVACLQVRPDAAALIWLADRVGSEKPFLGYHAALALLYAVRARIAPHQQLRSAVQKAKGLLEPEDRGSDRAGLLDEAETAVAQTS
jgi:hypothetical protein